MAVATSEPDADRRTLVDYLSTQIVKSGHSAELPEVVVLGVTDAARLPLPADNGADGVPILLTAGSAILGPVPANRPGRRPCRHCLALRWQRLRAEPVRTALERGSRTHSVARSPYLTPFALHTIWLLWRALSDAAGDPRDGVATGYEVDLATLHVSGFELLVDSDCPRCAPRRPDTASRARINLTARVKSDVDSYRAHSLPQHDLPVRALVNPVCGALGRRAVLGLSSPTTAPSMGRFQVGNHGQPLQDVTWGGQTNRYDTSEVAALLEGLERYAGMAQRRLTGVIVDTLDRLGGHALDPRECGVYADESYRNSPALTPFRPDRPIPWVWAYSLRDNRPVLVPRRLVYYGPSTADDYFVYECSSGCASGGSIEEAVLHGLLELVERDSFLLAWYGKARLPEIDPATCGATARLMVDRVRMYGYDIRLFDARIDLPIPVVIAVAVRRDGGPGALSFAAGASLDPGTAVESALAEVASFAPTMAEQATERLAEVSEMVTDFTKVATINDHSALFALPEMVAHAEFLLARRPKADLAGLYREWDASRPRTLDLCADLRFTRDLLTGAGFDVLVADQTAPEQELLGLRTACVLVPGLLPIDFGWTRQRALRMPRLRTAFRQAGWRATDLDESELHRVPHPFP